MNPNEIKLTAKLWLMRRLAEHPEMSVETAVEDFQNMIIKPLVKFNFPITESKGV